MIEFLSFPFFQRALIVGSILGPILALLGVFVVSRRLAFFADAIGHSSLTGIALGILLGIDPFFTAFITALAVAAALTIVRQRSRLSLDTLLGVAFSAAVALGVILVQRSPGYQTNLIAFLFGDILAVTTIDVVTSLALAFLVIICLVFFGKKFISITFHQDLASSEGIAVTRYELLLLLLLAGSIALAIKQIGVILVTAMVIIPAASAQYISRSLTAFFVLSAIFGFAATITGMLMSAALETPSGPTIVLVGAIGFIMALIWRSRTAT